MYLCSAQLVWHSMCNLVDMLRWCCWNLHNVQGNRRSYLVYSMFLTEWISMSEINTATWVWVSLIHKYLWRCPVFTESAKCAYIMIYKRDFALKLAVYHLAQMTVTLSYLCCFVLEYLLFVVHQRTPLDVPADRGHEAVVSYLKRAADPNVLEVSMWDRTIEDSCGVKWRSTHTNRHIIAAICFTCESSTHESSLNWSWWPRSTCLLLMHEVELL